jgi:hypothetical protein
LLSSNQLEPQSEGYNTPRQGRLPARAYARHLVARLNLFGRSSVRDNLNEARLGLLCNSYIFKLVFYLFRQQAETFEE